MKKFKYLKKNGKISIIAPSFGCAIEPYQTRLKTAISNFEKLGYSFDFGPNIYLNKSDGRSNTAKKCAKEFMDAYLSNSDVIISVGGGETMCEILPYIDFEKIKKLPPKVFMGFSDNTNLTYTLATIAEVPTIYGPNFPNFAFLPFKYSTLDSFNLLTNKTKLIKGYPVWQKELNHQEEIANPLKTPKYSEKKVLKVYSKNTSFNVTGRLLGGCLDCLIVLCGTKYDKTKEYIEKYKEDGFIWFLESCDLNPISIERALFQLKEAGWFKYIKGLIFGRPLCFDETLLNINHYKAISTIVDALDVPYVVDVDLGHFDPSMPLITGSMANVYIKNKNIFIKYLGI